MDQSLPSLSEAEQGLIQKYLKVRQDIEEELLSYETAVDEACSTGTIHEQLSSREKFAFAIRRFCQHESAMKEMGHGKSVDEDRNSLKSGIKILEDTVQIRKQLNPIDDSTLLNSQYELALMYHDNEDTFKAFQLLEKVTEIQNSWENVDHSSCLEYYSTLAEWYQEVNNMAKAIALLEWTVKTQRIRLGKEHDDTIFEQLMLAQAYFQQKEYFKTTQLLEEAVQLLHQRCETTDPTLISAQSLLANTYMQMGHYQQAVSLFETISEVQKNHYWEVQQLLLPSTLQLLDKARNSLDTRSLLDL